MAQPDFDPKPPYLAYRTFERVVSDFQQGIPARIDKSLFPSQSGGTQGQILGTLCFLGLITEDGDPTEELRELAGADESTSPPILERVFRKRFSFIFNDDFDLEKATTKQLEDAFREQGLEGSTLQKGTRFFRRGCKAAGITVSPRIQTRRARLKSTSVKAKRKTSSSPQPQTMQQMLMAKFPDFDPEWPTERQDKWFDAFIVFQRNLGDDVATGDIDDVDEDDGQEQ